MRLEKITHVVPLEKVSGDYKIVGEESFPEEAKEAVRNRYPQQIGEITIKVDDSNREEIPRTVRDSFPDYLKGNNNGTIIMPVYVFGREHVDGKDFLDIGLHRNVDGKLTQIFGVDITDLEDYKSSREFYSIPKKKS